MRHLSLLTLLALAPATLPAHDVGLLFNKQLGQAQTANLVYVGSRNGEYDAVSPTGVGVRVGFTLLNLKVAEIGLEGTYQPTVKGDVIIAGHNTGYQLSNQYFAIGAKAEWKFLVNLYVGAEIRQEKLECANESVNYSRPWAKVGVGMSFPLPVVSPFVRLEYAAPATKDDKTGDLSQLLKALAPRHQIGLYAGIRF